MKNIVLFIFLAININLFCQTKFDFTASCKIVAQQNKLIYNKEAIPQATKYSASYSKKAKRLKIAGAVFTGIGGAGLLVSGAFMTKFAIDTKKSNSQNNFSNGFATAYIIIAGIVPSSAVFIIGLPPLIIGICKTKKYQKSISK